MAVTRGDKRASRIDGIVKKDSLEVLLRRGCRRKDGRKRKREWSFGGKDAKLKFLKGAEGEGREAPGVSTAEIIALAYDTQRRRGCREPPHSPPSPSVACLSTHPGRTRNATLVRYGLSFVIPLSGDCDTEDTTASRGRRGGGMGEYRWRGGDGSGGDLIQFAYPPLYAPARIFGLAVNPGDSRCARIRVASARMNEERVGGEGRLRCSLDIGRARRKTRV